MDQIAKELPAPGHDSGWIRLRGMDVIVRPLFLFEHGRCGAIGQAVFWARG